MKAIDKIAELYISEIEMAQLLNVDPKRIRDLRSHHMQGKQEFIDHIKPTGKCVLYKLQEVLDWLNAAETCSFGKNKDTSEPKKVSDIKEKSS